MDERQISLIKHSWNHILPQKEETGGLFYQTLFWDDPSLRFLFGTNLSPQIRKFMDMMTFIVDNLQPFDRLEKELKALAHRHFQYGVLAVDYDTVGDALMKTLAERLQEQWTPETEIAWRNLYRTITQLMLNSLKSRL
ncbi:globin domain-containing protein [Larkinella rosea]|uniref:Hemin receptor n=1 Tax=Larkinella rosea TaxID=2025312 RepID=A0A3P1BIQ8_9BACT|nr:globin domain-containing protein [Larkinella rosea]RRB00999.1 hemin receptor [Larkinella rosea]